MSQTSVFCFATSLTQAGQIVDQLKAASFSINDISALLADHPTSRNFAQVKPPTKATQGAQAGACIVGVIGGVLGWIAGMGVLNIPGFSAFFGAGPILAALSGVAVGAVLGGISGGLIGLGFPALEEKCDDDKLGDGNILISVHAENAAEITQAEGIFAHAGAQGICTKGERTDLEDNRATEILTYPAEFVLKSRAR